MKGDFSRYRFDPAKHYTAVLEQQGRVQLDADANEQRAIDAHRLLTETVDVIGRTGAPRHAAGFEVSLRPDNQSLMIGAGRCYVDGLLCEAAAEADYGEQAWLIGPQPGLAAMLSALRLGRARSVQVWLEAWQRLVTPIDDPCLKDVALGEADTTVRLQTVWRVVADEVAPAPTEPPALRQALDTLRQSIAAFRHATQSTAFDAVDAAAATLITEIARGDTGTPQVTPALLALHAESSALLPRIANLPGETGAHLSAALGTLGHAGGILVQESCCAAMRRQPLKLLPGKMTASTDDISGGGPCLPSPHAAFRGLENQLYRIEVHEGGPLSSATFKWSRDNGSVVTAILEVAGAVLTVDNLGPDANLGFAPLQWVEISDDSDEFGQAPNQPGQLRQIKSVDFDHNRITLTRPAPAVDTKNGHAKLRRWDHTDAGATEAGLPMAPGGWHSLENGIRVQFAGALPFRPGDFWLVPARTATGALEWPPCGGDNAEYQPARNTVIHRAPLACIHWEARARRFVVEDCRDLFLPLNELQASPPPAALHVAASGMNWANDDVMTLDRLAAAGLAITLDGPPDPAIDAASFIVIAEVPLANQFVRNAETGAAQAVFVAPRAELILDGAVSVKENTILWSLPPELANYLQNVLEPLDPLANRRVFTRVRVCLKGRLVRGAQSALFLDGQCFGTPSLRADGKTPRADLGLPSGASEKASDFESWFYLAPTPLVASLTVTPASVAWFRDPAGGPLRLVDATATSHAAVPPTLSLTLNYAALADTTVSLSVSGGTLGTVELPASITVLRGTKSAPPVPVTVRNSGKGREDYLLHAQTILATGQSPSAATTTLTVTGLAEGVPVLTAGPFAPSLLGGPFQNPGSG